MFYDFRKFAKENNLRGWRMEKKDNTVYLSKFDAVYNDDEYRFYIEFVDGEMMIKKSEKIKNYANVKKIRRSHPIIKESEKVLSLYNQFI